MIAIIQRGEVGFSRYLAFWTLSIIIIEIIVSSDLISGYKVIVGLLNVCVLVYLNIFSAYFKNKIIDWTSKIISMKDKMV